MGKLEEMIAAHPIDDRPYNAIKFVRVDGYGSPLYRVGSNPKEMGAAEAIRIAFEAHGGHCYHCKTWNSAQPLSHECTRDHVRPKTLGGGNYLHNLVVACGACNRKKGGRDLVEFRIERGAEYLRALDDHLVRCLKALKP